MKTDAQRRAQNKYEAKHFATVGCKLKKEYAERFRAECAARNTTPNAVLTKAIAEFLGC